MADAVEPMQIGEPDAQAAPGLRVFDAERDDEPYGSRRRR